MRGEAMTPRWWNERPTENGLYLILDPSGRQGAGIVIGPVFRVGRDGLLLKDMVSHGYSFYGPIPLQEGVGMFPGSAVDEAVKRK